MFARRRTVLGGFAAGLLLGTCSAAREPEPAAGAVDPSLRPYAMPAEPLAGALLVGGSGTMERFVAPLVTEFCGLHPKVSQEVTLRGSTTVPTGLAQHEYNVGLMSRAMTFEEKASVKRETGHDVVEMAIAADGILVLVNKDNPIKGITLPQLDALFGTKRLAGYEKPVANWGDLGVAGKLRTAKIAPYGILEEKNGTVETFRRLVLLGGPLNRQVGNIKYPEKEFGQAVAADPAGISYSMEHAPADGARAIGVAAKEGAAYVMADPKTIGDGSYPLFRHLYVYLSDRTDEVAVDFVRFALSAEGQKVVAANSAASLPAKLIEKQLEQLAPPAAK